MAKPSPINDVPSGGLTPAGHMEMTGKMIRGVSTREGSHAAARYLSGLVAVVAVATLAIWLFYS